MSVQNSGDLFPGKRGVWIVGFPHIQSHEQIIFGRAKEFFTRCDNFFLLLRWPADELLDLGLFAGENNDPGIRD